MTRLQKKCFLFSIGMHCLLLVILVGSSAFRAKPTTKDMQLVMTMISLPVQDRAGVGGGSPQPAAAPKPPQPAPPAPAVVQVPQPVAQPKPVEPVEEPSKPEEAEKETTSKPLVATEPSTKPVKKPHAVVPEYTLASAATHTKPKTRTKPSESATSEAESRAEAKHVQQQVAAALEGLATGVKSSGAAGTVVDMPGQGGGEAFIGYETFIFNAYYRAWTPPDSIADKQAGAGVKIVVARDGTIVSSEIIDRSGKPALDKSVERALRLVSKLPPFPESTHDEQRTFLLRFNLEAKESSG